MENVDKNEITLRKMQELIDFRKISYTMLEYYEYLFDMKEAMSVENEKEIKTNMKYFAKGVEEYLSEVNSVIISNLDFDIKMKERLFNVFLFKYTNNKFSLKKTLEEYKDCSDEVKQEIKDEHKLFSSILQEHTLNYLNEYATPQLV